MRILYSTHMAPPYIDPAPWPGEQVICGPGWPDGPRSIRTPKALYDVAEVVARLPDGWRPDLFIAYVDSHGLSVPQNLSALTCPKILLVGDLHHGDRPLTKLLRYVAMERYDLHVVLFTRQSCHWFVEAGVAPVVHCGAPLLIRPYEGEIMRERFPVIGFAGQAGPHHVRRRRLVEGLVARGLPVHAGDAPQDVALRKWAKCQLAFNCSLNGDLNMRVFEILSAGGCLFTDQLCEEAGLTLGEGSQAIYYESDQDCFDKAAYWLARPDECLRIGLAGREAFLAEHSPAVKMDQLLAVVTQGTVHPSLLPPPTLTPPDAPSLHSRVSVYEILQERHRRAEDLDVMFDGSRLAAYAMDAADLPRITPRLTPPAVLSENWRSRKVVHEAGGKTDVLVMEAGDPIPPHVQAKYLLVVGIIPAAKAAELMRTWRIVTETTGAVLFGP
jgi:hypothetical protein